MAGNFGQGIKHITNSVLHPHPLPHLSVGPSYFHKHFHAIGAHQWQTSYKIARHLPMPDAKITSTAAQADKTEGSSVSQFTRALYWNIQGAEHFKWADPHWDDKLDPKNMKIVDQMMAAVPDKPRALEREADVTHVEASHLVNFLEIQTEPMMAAHGHKHKAYWQSNIDVSGQKRDKSLPDHVCFYNGVAVFGLDEKAPNYWDMAKIEGLKATNEAEAMAKLASANKGKSEHEKVKSLMDIKGIRKEDRLKLLKMMKYLQFLNYVAFNDYESVLIAKSARDQQGKMAMQAWYLKEKVRSTEENHEELAAKKDFETLRDIHLLALHKAMEEEDKYPRGK